MKQKYQPLENLKIKNWSEVGRIISNSPTSSDYELFKVADSAYHYANTLKYLGLIDRKKEVNKLSRLKQNIRIHGKSYRYQRRHRYPFYFQQEEERIEKFIIYMGKSQVIEVENQCHIISYRKNVRCLREEGHEGNHKWV